MFTLYLSALVNFVAGKDSEPFEVQIMNSWIAAFLNKIFLKI